MSWSQELKDFVSGWNTSSKLSNDKEYKSALTAATTGVEERASDPETLKLAKDTGEERLKSLQEANKSAPVSRGYTQALTETIRANRERAAKEAAGETTGTGLLPGGPALRSTITPDSNTPVATTTPVGAIPVENPALYADGGLVPDEGDDEEGTLTPAPAVGAVGPPSDATDFSARGRTPSGMAPQLLSDAHSAVKGGYKHLEKEFSLGGTGIKTAAQKRKALAFQKGAGGLSPEEMDAARKTIDPENKLTESQRNLAALGAVYQFWQNKGDGEKAQRVAGQMLQHYRTASERYAAIAAHAAEQGNLDVATQAAVKAYANVPDGRDMTIRKTGDGNLIYEYTDENGKTLSKGIATPQQLASSAMGLVQGGFDKAILSAAGQREEEAKASGKGTGEAVGGSAPKSSDRKTIREEISEPITKAKEEWKKKNPDKEPDEALWGDIHDAAEHIMGQNKTTTREAVRAAQELVAPLKSSPTETPWKVTDKEGGGVRLKMRSGVALDLDDDQFDTLMNQRAARVKAAMVAEDQAKADATKPGFMDKVGKAAGEIGGAVSNIAGEAGQAVGVMGRIAGNVARGAISDETVERGGALARRVGNDIERNTRNPGAIPVDPQDRPL